jgi:hypothetical protein
MYRVWRRIKGMESTVIFQELDPQLEKIFQETAQQMGFTTRKAYKRLEVDFYELEQLKDLIAVVIVVQESVA